MHFQKYHRSLYGFVVVHVDGVRLSLNCGHQLAYCSSLQKMSMESHGRMTLTGENRNSETCPSATLYKTNPTWTDLDVNLGLSDEAGS
jgi:hypothetical protein